MTRVAFEVRPGFMGGTPLLALGQHLHRTTAAAALDLQSLGWLWIDPAQSMFLGASLYPRTMAQLVSVPIPNQPWLAGVELRMQCLASTGSRDGRA